MTRRPNVAGKLGDACEVIAIRLTEGGDHDHVRALRLVDSATRALIQLSRKEFVDWLSQSGRRATVRAGLRSFDLHVVAGEPAYVRARGPNGWTDHLLALPRF